MNRLELLLKTGTIAVALAGTATVIATPRIAFAAEAGCTSHLYECERQDMPHINANCIKFVLDEYTGALVCVEWRKMPATYYTYTPPWP